MAAAGTRGRGRHFEPWPGYVDVLSTLLMVVIFVLMVFVIAQVFLSRALSGRVRAGIRRLLYEQTDTQPGARTLIVGLTLQLVAALTRVAAAPDPSHTSAPADANRRAVERFLAELAHRFYEPVAIDRVTTDLGMSRRSFTRLFRAAAGASYADYVERVRVEYACRLLRTTTRAIAPIAFECGYEELSSFYRAFKRQTRQTPGRFRESGKPVPALRKGGPIRQSR